MSYEELGLSDEEQSEMRARAVYGALVDELEPLTPIKDELISDGAAARVREAIVSIGDSHGVSEEEAMLILTEQIILERKKEREE